MKGRRLRRREGGGKGSGMGPGSERLLVSQGAWPRLEEEMQPQEHAEGGQLPDPPDGWSAWRRGEFEPGAWCSSDGDVSLWIRLLPHGRVVVWCEDSAPRARLSVPEMLAPLTVWLYSTLPGLEALGAWVTKRAGDLPTWREMPSA